MQTFATPAPITAILTIPAGRIQITAADRADTTVEIRPADPAKSRDVKLAGQVTAGYSDGTLRITAPAGHRVLGSSGAVEVTVRLPAGSRVEAKTASAQFTTAGPLGEVVFDSAQATVNVEQAATARLSAVDGGITVGRWAATPRSAPCGATSRSARPPAARSCCAPRPARLPSARPPGSRPPWTRAPRWAGSATRCERRRHSRPEHPRDHHRRRHHRQQPVRSRAPSIAPARHLERPASAPRRAQPRVDRARLGRRCRTGGRDCWPAGRNTRDNRG